MIVAVGAEMLNRLGYTVLEAKGGREAIEIYRAYQDRIDLVILDMVMPDMNGGEVYDRMKDINPDVKALLSSGYGINGRPTEMLAQRCNGFIQKPFGIKELAEIIREILGQN
jgi:CheY-like chemotaxis protein